MQRKFTISLMVKHNFKIRILPTNINGENVGKDRVGDQKSMVFKKQLEAALLIPGKCHYFILVNY